MTLELSKTHGIFFRKDHFNKAVCSWVTPRLLWSDSGLISTLHPPTLRKAFFFFSEGWTKNQRVCAACTPPLHATQVQGVIPCMLEDGISFFLITFIFFIVCVCMHTCHSACTEVRGSHTGVGSLLPLRGPWGLTLPGQR